VSRGIGRLVWKAGDDGHPRIDPDSLGQFRQGADPAKAVGPAVRDAAPSRVPDDFQKLRTERERLKLRQETVEQEAVEERLVPRETVIAECMAIADTLTEMLKERERDMAETLVGHTDVRTVESLLAAANRELLQRFSDALVQRDAPEQPSVVAA
jgi:hypothetical protein